MKKTRSISLEQVEGGIRLVRGHRVILDADLAVLYGVSTKALVQAVTRNRERFPVDFMFRLSAGEFANLRSQIVTSRLDRGWGGRRHPPLAFTEQGVAMLSSVLRSRRAARVNVQIMRVFVRIRQMLSAHSELARKLGELEKRYDHQFSVVFEAIRQLMVPPEDPPARRIGFHRGQ